jgi:hypothetical protein
MEEFSIQLFSSSAIGILLGIVWLCEWHDGSVAVVYDGIALV